MKYEIHSLTFRYEDGRKLNVPFDTVPFRTDDIEYTRNRLLSCTYAKGIDFTYEEIPVYN